MTASSHERSGPGGRWVGPDPAPWEQKVLRLIAEQYAIPMDLLAQFLRLEPTLTVELMKEFHRRKWVHVKRFFVNDEPWVWLKGAGLDHSGTGFARRDPSFSKLPYYRAVGEIRLALENQHPEGEWISNRALWPKKSERGHVPNALFRVPKASGEIATWAIEVEWSEKSTKRYKAIVSHRCQHYDRALFYCTPELARKFERIPEFEYAKVHISESLKELSKIENFQWRMSPAHKRSGRPRKKIEPWEGKVIRLIAEQYAVPGDQFARFLGFEPEAAQRIANHLDAAGFIDQGKGPPDEPPWLWVTPAGARVAETGLAPSVPSLFGLRELRCMNEARLLVRELDPTGQWWSKAMLLRGNRDMAAPAGVVRQGDKEYAVEIEPDLRERASLVNKYERRYAEHRSERRGVLVFCRTDKVELFEELKQEHGWADLYVEGCRAFDTSGVRPPRPLELVHVDAADLPEALLQEVAAKEGLNHRPYVAMAARRKLRGLPRWRITTERQVWAIVETPLGCSASPADEMERRERVLPPKPSKSARKKGAGVEASAKETNPKPEAKSESEKPGGSLPVGALMEIQARAGLAALPAGLSIMKDPTSEVPRWRVELGDEIWWVTEKPRGGCVATPDGEDQPTVRAAKPGTGAKRRSAGRSPRDPEGVMKDIDVSEVPREALDAIQREAGSKMRPKVLFAAKRRGSGSPRWRIGTDMDIWRVAHSPHGWLARLSE